MIDLGIVLSQIAKEVWYWKVNNAFLLLKLLRKVVNKILLVQCNWRNGKCSQQEGSIDSTYGLTCITCVTINDMYVSLDPHGYIFAAINKAGVFFLKVLIIYRHTEVFKSYTDNVIILSVNKTKVNGLHAARIHTFSLKILIIRIFDFGPPKNVLWLLYLVAGKGLKKINAWQSENYLNLCSIWKF